MKLDDVFAAYEALLARAVHWTRGMGELAPTHAEPDERWLSRELGHIRLHWLDDEGQESSQIVPAEAFLVDDAEFAAYVLIKRVERDERREANIDAYADMVKRFFDEK